MCFQPRWYKLFPWLDYDIESDTSFCYICKYAEALGHLTSHHTEIAFTRTGFCRWKQALEKKKGFTRHQDSEAHKTAVLRLITAPATSHDIAVLIDDSVLQQQANNRMMFIKVMRSVQLLLCRGFALRGEWQPEKGEEDNNLLALLKFSCFGKDQPDIEAWLSKKYNKFISPLVINEIIKLFGQETTRLVVKKIKDADCRYFSVMADETSDVSRKEQLVVCIRWIDNNFIPHEDYLKINVLNDLKAKTISDIILDCLKVNGLDIEDARGQCYDGASVMKGEKGGVAAIIKEKNGSCLYIHCHGHSLNLACGDTIKQIPCLKDAFDIARELIKFIRKSPKKSLNLLTLRKESENPFGGIHDFCDTRCTVRGSAMESIINNFHEITELLENRELITDSEQRIKAVGLMTSIRNFSFLFGCKLAAMIMKQFDRLSQTLQDPSLSSVESYKIAMMTVKTMKKDRSDLSFSLFMDSLKKLQENLEIEEAVLPRKRKRPAKITNYGTLTTQHHPETVEELYCPIYFEALDMAISTVSDRFDQEDFKIQMSLEQMLIKAVKGELDESKSEIRNILPIFPKDFSEEGLAADLDHLCAQEWDAEDGLKSLKFIFQKKEVRKLLPEVTKVLQIILISPATNAVSERSFSKLKLIKTYLRSTCGDERLACLMICAIYKDMVMNIDLVELANTFVGDVSNRISAFGKFCKSDVC